MKYDIYTHAGKKSGSVDLSDVVFGQEKNHNLVHQVVTSMLANKRQVTAHTKDRSEVSGGGKKPWRQKGTGRARHGSSRSPIWVGGGVTFGPRNDRNYTKKINSKMRIAALYTALSSKLAAGRMVFVDSLGASDKTRDINQVLKNLESVDGFSTINTRTNRSNLCVVLPEYNEDLVKVLRNIPHVTVTDALSLNTLDVVNHRYLLVVDPALCDKILVSRHHTLDTILPERLKKKEEVATK